MIACPRFSGEGAVSVADALRSVDCLSGQAVEIAFQRLFGAGGALGQALTLILILYVALFALSLLTGRTGLRMNMLTPRMLQLGLVLTFATSWVAYQTVGWNLLIGAPDQVASILLGTQESATALFAQQLDKLFDVIANSAHLANNANAQVPLGTVVPQIAGTSPKPADLLWAASLLLLLGTVGVLIVTKIALAAVMGLGSIFIIFALFSGTRGLFEGWLKAVVMLALTPLLAVLLGGGTMVMIAPMIRVLQNAGGNVSLQLATSIFLAVFVYVALMVLAMRAAAKITSGWHLGKGNAELSDAPPPVPAANAAQIPIPMLSAQAPMGSPTDDRLRGIMSGMSSNMIGNTALGFADATPLNDRRAALAPSSAWNASDAPNSSGLRDPRIRPLGQGFRAPNAWPTHSVTSS